jgi:hypothetical protein
MSKKPSMPPQASPTPQVAPTSGVGPFPPGSPQHQVPTFYMNGIGIAVTAADISVVMILNGNPVGNLIISYATAKTLADGLQQAVERFEKATGQRVKDNSELQKEIQTFMAGS